MLAAVHSWLTRRATWKTVALLLVGFYLCIAGFNLRAKHLPPGDPPDGRFGYTPADLRTLFDDWGPAGRHLYASTQLTLDVAFPLVYGLLISAVTAQLFRVGRWRLLVLPAVLTPVFDLLENVTLVTLVGGFDGRESPLAWLAATFTVLKWLLGTVSLGVLVLGGVKR